MKEKKKFKVYVAFSIHIFFSFWVLRKKKLFMSPVPPFSLSLSFLSFFPSVPKMRTQRDGWQMFIGKRRLILSRFLSLFNSIALNNACATV